MCGLRYQVSLTAGTILDHTKTRLTTWFWAAVGSAAVTDKRGLSDQEVDGSNTSLRWLKEVEELRVRSEV